MLRKRLATLAVMAGLGLSLGCSSTSTSCSGGLFDRLCNRVRTRTTTVSEAFPVVDPGLSAPVCDGPILESPGPEMPLTGTFHNGTYPNGGAPYHGQTLPGTAFPSLVPPMPSINGGGRLLPTPQAQPMPFTP